MLIEQNFVLFVIDFLFILIMALDDPIVNNVAPRPVSIIEVSEQVDEVGEITSVTGDRLQFIYLLVYHTIDL